MPQIYITLRLEIRYDPSQEGELIEQAIDKLGVDIRMAAATRLDEYKGVTYELTD